jgi:hypothetical protein
MKTIARTIALAFALLLASFGAAAQTASQLATLKSYILADPVLSLKTSGPETDYAGIATAMSAIASPAFIVWKTSVTIDEVTQSGLDYSRVDNLTVGKSRIWDWLFASSARAINCGKVNVRAGIDAVWVGTAADLAVRATVYTLCKRSATVAEKVLASGTGSDASPAVLGFEGGLTTQTVAGMFNQ